jgi:hypothetical protein
MKGKKMIIDYNDRKNAIAEGIVINKNGDAEYHGSEQVRSISFKNFQKLQFENVTIEDCRFDNCGEVSIYDGEVRGCNFCNVSAIEGHYASFTDCIFSRCCSYGALLTIDSEGGVEGCSFENITALSEDGYVIFSVYKSKNDVRDIERCSFVDCICENEEEELASCSYFKPFSSFKTVDVDNMDYESCNIKNTSD